MHKNQRVLHLMLLCGLLAALDVTGLLRAVKTTMDIWLVPVKQQIYVSKTVLVESSHLVFEYRTLQRNARALSSLLQKNEELALELRLTKEENEQLRKQLGSPLPSSFSFIAAPVVGINRYMEIGVGEASGVKEHMPVVVGQQLIGVVQTVSRNRSNVLLITSSEATVPVKTSRGVKGVLIGQFDKGIRMDTILQKDPLFLQDQVMTSGEGGFPANLIVGRVTHITASDEEVYKQASIVPLVEVKSEQVVFVISSL